MSIITLILVLAAIGFGLWLLFANVPMLGPFKPLIIAIVTIATLLWILNVTGIYSTRLFHL